jgi:hypothetical protein
MKIEKLSDLHYDPLTKTLSLIGTSALGKQAHVDIHVDDADALAVRVAGALLGDRNSHPALCGAAVADALQVAILGADERYVVAFRFFVGSAEFSTVVGVLDASEERLRAIKIHLDKALSEIAGGS